MRLINHWNSFLRGTVPFLPLKVLNSRWNVFFQENSNSANCSTIAVGGQVGEDGRVLLWPWRPWVRASWDGWEAGPQPETCLLRKAKALNDAWGTRVRRTDAQLWAGGAQRSTVSSSWSKTRPGRLRDGAGSALSSFSYPFPLLPRLWATATCKAAVKLCRCWTRINLKALEKSAGKLKTFLEVRKKCLMNDKEENRSQWDTMVGEKYSLLQNPVVEEIPQRKEDKVLPTWQWMTAFSCPAAWKVMFPPRSK